ncbi:hypothetical protein V470_10790 [Streptococcus sp. VT 162]|nr:hypothetical protein V470_10790 [Streptococcus sp. VT 162]
MAKNEWVDGGRYYVDSDGKMVKSDWIYDKNYGSYYYLTAEGKVAYHGTKLVGGSEEDAQIANFIGNIVGGYVTSSAASKFSLNKVTNLLLYKDGYYQIDGDLHTKLPGQVFTNLHSALKSSRDNLKSEIEILNTTKDNISDLVSYEGSSHTSTVMDYNFLMNQLKNLDTSITQYESNHASQDLVAFKELLAATKALIAEHAGKTRTVGTYQSGDFAKLK